ncbi:MAG: retropepsin-like aspartic protease [Rhodospirillales bacterium]
MDVSSYGARRHRRVNAVSRLLAIAAAMLFHHAALASCPAGQAAVLPLTLWHGKLLVPVGINGAPQMIALDTGAGISTISTAVANSIDLPHDFDRAVELGGVGGRNSILNIGQVATLELDKVRLTHLAMPIADMEMKTQSGAPVAGLLGADVLHGFDVEIDVPAGRLVLWSASECPAPPPSWASDDPIPFELDEGNHILVDLRVEGARLTGVLDTGAPGLAVTEGAAFRTGLTEDALDGDIPIHGIGVNNRAWKGHLHRFSSIKFGGLTFRDTPSEIIPSNMAARNDALIGADALIGMELLQHTRLWICYRTKMLYLQSGPRSNAD